MFISNTASAAMVLAVIGPVLRAREVDRQLAAALCLAVPLGASLGGMGTPIGSPPNAVVLGQLGTQAPSFSQWMLAGVPPSAIISILG